MVNDVLPYRYSLRTYHKYLYVADFWVFPFDVPIVMYLPCIFPYIDGCFHIMFLLYSFHSSRLIFSKISIFIRLSSTCWNPTKSAGGQPPWGAPIMKTNLPRATSTSAQTLIPHPRHHRDPLPWCSQFFWGGGFMGVGRK